MIAFPVLVEQLVNALQLGLMLFLAAAGLTLVFGIMNFINLAHGSLYMAGAFIGASALARTGSFVVALLAGLTGAALVALALEVTVLRRLYARDHGAQVLATFGLILLFNEGLRILFGNAPLFIGIPAALEGSVPLFDGATYPVYRLAVMVAGVVVAGALAFLITRTRLGARIRAGASNREMLQALGVHAGALFAFVLALGGALAGLAGTLMGPLQSVQVGMGEPILILAFVVIVIGGIGSVRGAFVGALAVGLVDTFGRFLFPKLFGYTLGPALASVSIYLLMAVMLAVKPAGLFPAPAAATSGGGATTEIVRSTGIPRGAGLVLCAIAFLALALVPLSGEPHVVRILTRAMIMAIAAVGLDLAFGYGGMLSFGHAAFLGVGAYTVGILAAHGISSALVVLPLAVLFALVAGVVVGVLSIRASGIFFIMITLAFAQMAYYIAIGLEPYGGDNGMPLKSATKLATLSLGKVETLYFVALVSLALLLAGGARLVRSSFGLALRGIRDNERRMRSLGFATARWKLAAFALSAAICGYAGALLANADAYVGPSGMHWFVSGLLMIMVILGGQGTLFGPALGAIAYVLVEEGLSAVTEHWMVIFGPLLVIAVLLTRHGLVDAIAAPFRRSPTRVAS